MIEVTWFHVVGLIIGGICVGIAIGLAIHDKLSSIIERN